jgi:hypothetical protein
VDFHLRAKEKISTQSIEAFVKLIFTINFNHSLSSTKSIEVVLYEKSTRHPKDDFFFLVKANYFGKCNVDCVFDLTVLNVKSNTP